MSQLATFLVEKYSESQPRDSSGRWSAAANAASAKANSTGTIKAHYQAAKAHSKAAKFSTGKTSAKHSSKAIEHSHKAAVILAGKVAGTVAGTVAVGTGVLAATSLLEHTRRQKSREGYRKSPTGNNTYPKWSKGKPPKNPRGRTNSYPGDGIHF